jgi:hypothetical protein
MNQDQCRYSSVAKCNVKPEDGTRVLQVAPTWCMAVDRAQPQGRFQYVCKHTGMWGVVPISLEKPEMLFQFVFKRR